MPEQRSGQRPDDLGQVLVDLITLGPIALSQRLAALSPQRLALVLEQASAHSVAPLLRHRLVEQGLFEQLPAPVRDGLDATYFTSSAQAMARYRELGVILQRLAAAGIPVIALKGIYLAKAVYPEPGLRPMADIDLLFRPEDLESVQSLLLALGYSQPGADHPISVYLDTSHELPGFFRDSTKVEVHMRIERPDAPFCIDHSGIWERARPWSLGEQALLAMTGEDLLLHLCVHAMYHHLGRIPLIALVDMARVIACEAMDWDLLIERARAWRAESAVFLGLELARQLAGAAAPLHVIDALRPAQGESAPLDMVRRTIFTPRTADRQDDGFKLQHARLAGYLRRLSGVRTQATWRDRLGVLRSRLFPERAVLERQYPAFNGSGWVRVMYAVHWLVVSGRFLRAAALNWRYWLTLRKLDRRWFS